MMLLNISLILLNKCYEVLADDYRLVVIDGTKNDLKTSVQLYNQSIIIKNHFRGNFGTRDPNNSRMYFMLETSRGDMAAFLVVERETAIKLPSTGNPLFDFLKSFEVGFKFFAKVNYLFTFFNVTVPVKFRGQNLSKRLIFAVKKYIDSQGYKDYYLALHLSCDDEHMPIAARVYYSMGFKHFTWVEGGPYVYFNNLTFFNENSADFYDICKSPNIVSTKGEYLASIIQSTDLERSSPLPVPPNYYELAAKIMIEMEKRKE